MPSINPYDYNIDNFNSQNLGPIGVEDFRTYILNYNLDSVNSEVLNSGFNNDTLNIYAPFLFNTNPKVIDLPNLSEVSFTPSVYNNNTSPRPDNKQKNIYKNDDPFYGPPSDEETFLIDGAKSLTSPGTIDSWLVGGGFSTDVFTIRNFVHLNNNEYGPTEIFDYSGINQVVDDTGFKSYSSINPVQTDNIISQVVLRTLGFSPTNFINFPSQLEDIAKERRLFETQSRIKVNFVTDTIGLLNLNTTQLLLGNGLITPDYVITRPPGLFSRVSNFTSNLAGFTVPVSILPGSQNTRISSNFFQEELIRFTGIAQKNLIYFNAYSSKYSSPLLSKGLDDNDEDSAGGILQNIKSFFKDLGREQTSNYLTVAEDGEEEGGSTLAERIGKFFNDLISPEVDETLIPTNEKSVNPQDPFKSMGVDGSFPGVNSLDENSTFNNEELNDSESVGPYKINNTTLNPSINDINDINNSHRSTTLKNFDWRSRENSVAKRGLLKYTQDMINSSKVNNNQGAARFIGRFDDDSNLVNVNGVQRHKDISKGSLIKNADNSAYCRSWSTRNPYQNHYDLIRNDRLYKLKNKTEYLSVLEDNGHVKIVPYNSDDNLIDSENGPAFNTSSQSKRYMFSIENLAWLDADEKLALPNCEIGPNGGRIMWFPPYEINFTDNTTASWETTTFLGRAEPIYTYNSTERKGTLSFKVITDHPSVLQEMKRKTEEEIYKFFSGCGLDIDDLFPKEIVQEVLEEVLQTIEENEEPITEEEAIQEPTIGDEQIPNPEPPRKDPPFETMKVYFENARRDRLVGGVRKGIGRDIQEELNRGYEINGLNDGVQDKIDELAEFLATEEGQNWGVEIIGYTSTSAPNDYNKVLSIDRATSVHKLLINTIKSIDDAVIIPENMKTASFGFVCNSFGKCLSETSNNKCFQNPSNKCYPNLNITNNQPPFGDFEKSMEGRFLIISKGETFAESEEGEDPNNQRTKSERYVEIKIFKNEDWIFENTTPKLTPKTTSISGGFGDEIRPLPSPPPLVGPLPLNPNTQFIGVAKDEEARVEFLNKSERRKRLEDENINTDISDTPTDEVSEKIERRVIERTVSRLFTECDYFEKIKKEDPFIYEKITEKIKYFHPAFHSTSPEGFNSRLNFLHQCLRQGPNVRPDETRVRNMAFGRPPVCILRLGDFYYTRILIDSLNITYEPLVWDMNPEGIGVQPMIANVDLNFSIIGGSSLSGPITQLQNAVSFNFFANTSVYNPARIVDTKLTGFYKTLEEKLTENAENFELNKNEVVFGSFESQESTDQFSKFFKNRKSNVVTSSDSDQVDGNEITPTNTNPQ